MVNNAEALVGDADGCVFNQVTKKKCKLGGIDILDVGFSCKSFSAQNTRNKDGEFDEAIKGESTDESGVEMRLYAAAAAEARSRTVTEEGEGDIV